MESLYLIAIVAVLVFGIGLVLWNRRRSGAAPATPAPRRPTPSPAPPAAPEPGVEVAVETGVAPLDHRERPPFSDPMSKARARTQASRNATAARGWVAPAPAVAAPAATAPHRLTGPPARGLMRA